MKRRTEAIDPEIERRCARVLDIAFRGLHHCPWEKRRALFEGVELSTNMDLSTFDFDVLTRLVVAAHDEAVRVSVCPSGPRLVAIRMYPRTREGSLTRRHPTMEEAIASVREWEPKP